MSQRFDRFMVHTSIGTNRKLRRLPVAQRWAYVAGVLALAAQSPIRGALLITDGEHVTAEDIAEEATIPVKDARAALAALRRLGMLQHDELGVEWVHDWDSVNPDPRPSDSPEATRERKRQQRARQREQATPTGHDVSRVTGGGGVTRDTARGHDPEVEVEVLEEEKPPPAPPTGGRKTDREKWEIEALAWARAVGVDGSRESLLRAVRQSAPWAVNGEAVEHFHTFVRQHFDGALEVAA